MWQQSPPKCQYSLPFQHSAIPKHPRGHKLLLLLASLWDGCQQMEKKYESSHNHILQSIWSSPAEPHRRLALTCVPSAVVSFMPLPSSADTLCTLSSARLYSSGSQPLWDHGLVISFFIRWGPGEKHCSTALNDGLSLNNELQRKWLGLIWGTTLWLSKTKKRLLLLLLHHDSRSLGCDCCCVRGL
jgi:hypothetical protein